MEKFDIENFPTSEAAKRMMASIDESFYEKSYVMKWMQQVMGLEWDDARRIIEEELPKQFVPETATWGLKYHEIKWQLPVRENLSYEERRKLIYQKRDFKAPMTPYRMEEYLGKVTGAEAYIMDCHDSGRYGFVPDHPNIFKAAFCCEGTLNTKLVRETLDKIKQSHTVYAKIMDCVWAVTDQSEIEKMLLQKIRMHTIISFFGTRLLNGSHFLDGSHYLDAGRRYWLMAGISCRAGSVQNKETFPLQALEVKAGITTGWENHAGAVFRSGIGFKTAGSKGSKVVKICLCIKEPREKIENAVATTKTKDYRFLNGSKFLDGSKKLDSVYREEKL